MKLEIQMNTAKSGEPYFAVHATDVDVSEGQNASRTIVEVSHELKRYYKEYEGIPNETKQEPETDKPRNSFEIIE